jgi:uncharacterized protein (DUF58 family)
MDTAELLRKVRQIDIKTRALSSNVFAGEYHSAFKGRGMSFSEVREYQAGDDIRDIDWNVTARFCRPYTKLFEEERELTVLLMVDVSGSLGCGAFRGPVRDTITEIAATLAYSAIENNDKIGVVFYSDKIEKYIPPLKGRKHILYIIRELLELEPEGTGTNLANALEFLVNTQKKRCSVFVLSDFIAQLDYKKTMMIASRKHELAAIQVYDRFMEQLPDVGLLKVSDSETGDEMVVDSSSKKVRNAHARYWKEHEQALADLFCSINVDHVSLSTEDNYVNALLRLFDKRR